MPLEKGTAVMLQTHLTMLLQLLFIVKGDLQNLRKYRDASRQNFYPRNGNQKHKKIFLPFQRSQSLLPSMILFIYMLCCLLGEPVAKHGQSKHSEFTWHRFIYFRDWLTNRFSQENSQVSQQILFSSALDRKVGSFNINMASGLTPRVCWQFKRQTVV